MSEVTNIEIEMKCDSCFKHIDIEAGCFNCEECEIENQNLLIKECVKEVLKYDGCWKDRDYYCGISEEDKTIFMKGARYGYFNALFWICDYFNEIQFWEKIEEEFEKKEKLGEQNELAQK